MTLKLGFIGLGMMGLPMLENLAGAEAFCIRAYDRDPQRFDRLKLSLIHI